MKGPLVGVGVFLIRDNKILLGKRKGSHGAGEWSLPGGHLEVGESFLECCTREVQEETGIQIDKINPLFFTNDIFENDDKHYVTLFFAASVSKETQAQNMEPDKCEGWEWFDPDVELPSPLFPH